MVSRAFAFRTAPSAVTGGMPVAVFDRRGDNACRQTCRNSGSRRHRSMSGQSSGWLRWWEARLSWRSGSCAALGAAWPRGDRRHDAVPRPRGTLPPLPRARNHPRRIRRRAGGPARREARARDPCGRAAGESLRVLARSQEPADHHAQSGVRAGDVRAALSLASEGAGRNDLRMDRGDHQRQAQRAHRLADGARRSGRACRFRPFRSKPGRRHDRPGFAAIRPPRGRADSHADPDARRGSEQADRRRSRAAEGGLRAREPGSRRAPVGIGGRARVSGAKAKPAA